MTHRYPSYEAAVPIEYSGPKKYTFGRTDGSYVLAWTDPSTDFEIVVEARPRKEYDVYLEVSTASGPVVVREKSFSTKKEALAYVSWLKKQRFGGL